jgi:hypothetical protein
MEKIRILAEFGTGAIKCKGDLCMKSGIVLLDNGQVSHIAELSRKCTSVERIEEAPALVAAIVEEPKKPEEVSTPQEKSVPDNKKVPRQNKKR